MLHLNYMLLAWGTNATKLNYYKKGLFDYSIAHTKPQENETANAI